MPRHIDGGHLTHARITHYNTQFKRIVPTSHAPNCDTVGISATAGLYNNQAAESGQAGYLINVNKDLEDRRLWPAAARRHSLARNPEYEFFGPLNAIIMLSIGRLRRTNARGRVQQIKPDQPVTAAPLHKGLCQ